MLPYFELDIHNKLNLFNSKQYKKKGMTGMKRNHLQTKGARFWSLFGKRLKFWGKDTMEWLIKFWIKSKNSQVRPNKLSPNIHLAVAFNDTPQETSKFDAPRWPIDIGKAANTTITKLSVQKIDSLVKWCTILHVHVLHFSPYKIINHCSVALAIY